jgi:hypothetical protein
MPRPRASAGAGAATAVTPTAATVARTANVFFMLVSFASYGDNREQLRWLRNSKKPGAFKKR